MPQSWTAALGGWGAVWQGCENWWARFPLICWFQLNEGADGTKGKLRMIAEVGPMADGERRSNLINLIKSVAETNGLKDIRFQSSAAEAGKKYSKFLRNNTLEIDNIQDAKEISDAMIRLFKRFEVYFEEIAKTLSANAHSI